MGNSAFSSENTKKCENTRKLSENVKIPTNADVVETHALAGLSVKTRAVFARVPGGVRQGARGCTQGAIQGLESELLALASREVNYYW